MFKKLLILLCASIALSACEQPVQTSKVIRPVLAMRIANQSVESPEVILSGDVVSRYESSVGFRVPGKIMKRYVDVGDAVKQGQVLATIDAKDSNLNTLAARADVNAAQANHRLAAAELERKKQLFAKKFISKSALDTQQAQFDASLAQVKQAKSQAAVSSNQSVYTRLLADKAGMIAKITAEPGQVVAPGQTIATIIDLQHLEVAVPVPESTIAQLQVGDLVTVRTWADKSKIYQGKVREIPPAANVKTRAFDIKVSIIDADETVKAGMTAEVSFAKNKQAAKILIPSTAVTAKQNQAIVWVINADGIANMQAIEADDFSEQGVPVTAGLKVGDTIAIAGVHKLVEGQKVRPVYERSNRKY